jgi:hypothetical protein
MRNRYHRELTGKAIGSLLNRFTPSGYLLVPVRRVKFDANGHE